MKMQLKFKAGIEENFIQSFIPRILQYHKLEMSQVDGTVHKNSFR